MKIADLNQREDLILVTDSQDVKSVKIALPLSKWNYDGFLVKIEDGDYKEIYGFKGIVPDVSKDVVRLK